MIKRDEFGLIVQKDGDGGDTCNRLGLFYSALTVLVETDDLGLPPSVGLFADRAILTGNLPNGRYCRHPDKTKWYSNPNNVTRDQMAPMECALALNGQRAALKAHVALRAKRGMLHFSTQDQVEGHPNAVQYKLPDLCSPQELAVIIRGMGWKWLRPLLVLLDLFLLRELYLVEDARDGQIVINTAVAKQLSPTFVSKWCVQEVKRKQVLLTQTLTDYYSEANGKNGIEDLGKLLCKVVYCI